MNHVGVRVSGLSGDRPVAPIVRYISSTVGCGQDITLTVVSERSVREVSLDEDTDELSTVNVQSFVDEQEWRLYSNVETRVEVVTRVYQGDDCSEMMTMVYQGDDGLPRQRGSTRATMVYQGDDGLPGR